MYKHFDTQLFPWLTIDQVRWKNDVWLKAIEVYRDEFRVCVVRTYQKFDVTTEVISNLSGRCLPSSPRCGSARFRFRHRRDHLHTAMSMCHTVILGCHLDVICRFCSKWCIICHRISRTNRQIYSAVKSIGWSDLRHQVMLTCKPSWRTWRRFRFFTFERTCCPWRMLWWYLLHPVASVLLFSFSFDQLFKS